MSRNLTTSIQDYLKHVYELTEGGQSATTNLLAEKLNVKPASVTGMLQRLAAAEPALLNYRKHQGATLTAAGRKAALEVVRHHRLLEAWLTQTLGYSWDEVHEEAERLEHVISEDLEKRMAAALGNPVRDPHGEPIPGADLKMPPDLSAPLAALRPPQKATIRSIRSPDADLLRHLEALGLVPGAEVEVTSYSAFDHNSTVKVDELTTVLGLAITSKVLVERR